MSAAAHRRRKAQGTHDSVCSTPAGQHAHVYVCVTHRLSLAMRLLRDAQGTLYRKVNCDECNWQQLYTVSEEIPAGIFKGPMDLRLDENVKMMTFEVKIVKDGANNTNFRITGFVDLAEMKIMMCSDFHIFQGFERWRPRGG